MPEICSGDAASIRSVAGLWRSAKEGLIKSSFVIPANAGIQLFSMTWTPAFAGVTDLIRPSLSAAVQKE